MYSVTSTNPSIYTPLTARSNKLREDAALDMKKSCFFKYFANPISKSTEADLIDKIQVIDIATTITSYNDIRKLISINEKLLSTETKKVFEDIFEINRNNLQKEQEKRNVHLQRKQEERNIRLQKLEEAYQEDIFDICCVYKIPFNEFSVIYSCAYPFYTRAHASNNPRRICEIPSNIRSIILKNYGQDYIIMSKMDTICTAVQDAVNFTIARDNAQNSARISSINSRHPVDLYNEDSKVQVCRKELDKVFEYKNSEANKNKES